LREWDSPKVPLSQALSLRERTPDGSVCFERRILACVPQEDQLREPAHFCAAKTMRLHLHSSDLPTYLNRHIPMHHHHRCLCFLLLLQREICSEMQLRQISPPSDLRLTCLQSFMRHFRPIFSPFLCQLLLLSSAQRPKSSSPKVLSLCMSGYRR